MANWSKKYTGYRLKWFDTKSELKENFSFSRRIIGYSLKGISLSASILAIFCLLDWLGRLLFRYLDTFSNSSIACRVSEWYGTIHSSSHNNIDYFADVISIGAGVLGVLLGLFYTAFMTIVATKYSNINSAISAQLLNQKALNKYFTLLSTLTSLAVFFQLLISFGYKPTIISCVLFSVFIAGALSSFIKYGKFFLMFF